VPRLTAASVICPHIQLYSKGIRIKAIFRGSLEAIS
jgi:hypothetical protein